MQIFEVLLSFLVRYIIYGMVWLATMGKLHFWLLPNLTAECGFFESFVPAYEYSVVKKDSDSNEERRESETASADDGEATSNKGESPINETAAKKKNLDENNEDSDEKENGDWVKVKKNDADGLG